MQRERDIQFVKQVKKVYDTYKCSFHHKAGTYF